MPPATPDLRIIIEVVGCIKEGINDTARRLRTRQGCWGEGLAGWGSREVRGQGKEKRRKVEFGEGLDRHEAGLEAERMGA